jgi:hypothetical protein
MLAAVVAAGSLKLPAPAVAVVGVAAAHPLEVAEVPEQLISVAVEVAADIVVAPVVLAAPVL